MANATRDSIQRTSSTSAERSAALPDAASTGDDVENMAVDATTEARAIFRTIGPMRRYNSMDMAGP